MQPREHVDQGDRAAAHIEVGDHVQVRAGAHDAPVDVLDHRAPMQERQMRLRRDYGAVWRRLVADAAAAGALDPALDVHVARMLVLGALNWTHEPRSAPGRELPWAAIREAIKAAVHTS